MRVLGIIVNIFLPGVGTLLVGKVPLGIIQIVLVITSLLLSFTGVLALIGIPLGIGNWVWALVSAATPKKR